MRRILVVLPAVALTACPVPPSNAARAQEAAQDFNIDARFGRTELAIERVVPKEREAFALRHRGWGSAVRIADIEVSGMRLTSDTLAQVTVRVAWYKPSEEELRMTSIRQKWQNEKDGGWMLAGEERIEGDLGLLGEPMAPEPPPGPPTPPHESAHFPTIRIGERPLPRQDDAPPAQEPSSAGP